MASTPWRRVPLPRQLGAPASGLVLALTVVDPNRVPGILSRFPDVVASMDR